MKIHAIRRITHDTNHNAFTGAAWFQGALYVAFRQGDAHVCQQGRLIVMRSRDEGKSFDTVAVIRGEKDTRDAHLYVAGDKLYVVGFEETLDKAGGPPIYKSGHAWTTNGLNWSPWTHYQGPGVANKIFWRPREFKGRHYCAAYAADLPNHSEVTWFESADGVHWEPNGVIHGGADQPNECFLQFKPDGTAILIMRREHESRRPLLVSAKPPYREWHKRELDVALVGPCLWLQGEEIWISGRWFPTRQGAHVAIFRVDGDKPILRAVLPSGPGMDCSYMGVAQHPVNRQRFFLSYYSNHDAPENPAVSQWEHPDIYLADTQFDAAFIRDWKLSRLVADVNLAAAKAPDPADASLGWKSVQAGDDKQGVEPNFVDIRPASGGKGGLVYLVTDIEVGPTDRGAIHLGYDGPVRVWLNGQQVFEGPGNNPAVADSLSLPMRFQHGHNRLAIALDTNGGRAWGIFGRFDTES